ncbi:MAG: glutathione S-transferase family protein [bacterium]
MGLMIDGIWKDQWYDTDTSQGEFVRENSRFRNWITRDGKPGPDGVRSFPAEKDRYHLYVSLACPWAHRTLILRSLKKLQPVIPVSIVDPRMLNHGWEFGVSGEETEDGVNGFHFLHQLYTTDNPRYTGRVTVPVLWDKKTQTIVSNESSEIIRMFNSSFDAFTDVDTDYYPEALRSEIDTINQFVYENVNNGVYRCGFATSQSAYEKAFADLFMALDELERRLGKQRYLVGHQITEADWRFFTTLVRFDAVYFSHFKANRKRIIDYPNLYPYLLDLYQQPGIRETVNMDHIKTHYYYSHDMINPGRIVPLGPDLDFEAPHNRDRFTRINTPPGGEPV